MRFASSVASALGLTWLALAQADSDVLDLTGANFSEIVDKESLMLIEFFAPWCGHCKALAPHYEEAATALKKDNIKLAKVDCVDQADFCQQEGIQGYPTLRVYKNGQYTDYNGPRKADGIQTFMVKRSLPAVVPVTAENFEDVKSKDKLFALAYVSSTTEAPAPVFSELADKYRDDYLFGITTDASLAEKAGVKAPAVVVYRSYDEPRSDYPYPDPASATIEDFENWMGDLAVPILDEVNADNYGLYASSEKPLAYTFVDLSADNQALLDSIRAVATKYHSKVNFVYIDAVKFGEHAKALNIAEAKWPAFVLQDTVKQLKYPLSQEKDLTADAVQEWVAKYLDGGLKPELKSAPIPEQEGNVVEVVGKTFDEVVFDDSKDVFMEFYASWCGHCKRLKPIYDQLGDNFAHLKNAVTIAKMEAQENDLPTSVPFSIKGFPTIKFKPAGSRDWIDYEGDRSLENMEEFIKANAKNSLDAPAPSAADNAAQSSFKAEEAASATPAAEEPHATDEL